MKFQVLATDLDGTLIPLDGNGRNVADLRRLDSWLIKHQVELIFVTGRHLESINQVAAEKNLPNPDWMICDVGATIVRRDSRGALAEVDAYGQTLAEIVGDITTTALAEELSTLSSLTLQEPEKQGRYKLSYYADATGLDADCRAIQILLDQLGAPYGMIASVDPFNGDGLIDLLPQGVSKAFALDWLANHRGLDSRSIVFSGDSGNDLAALTAGHRSIVVANAADALKEKVRQMHQLNGWLDRLHIAESPATSGVLEGVKAFAASGS